MTQGLHKALIENPELVLKNNEPPPVIDFATNLTNLVANLEEHGVPADNIYVLNLADLSSLPAVRLSHPSKPPQITALSKKFNDALLDTMKYRIRISHILSLWDLTNPIDADPGKYGITNLYGLCTADEKEPACTGYASYDGIHPTIHTPIDCRPRIHYH
ncbi:MAG: hypothetical protein COB66_07615 [Coxiella sp. (in: Bacteria)]|nr:MAG: hypothetical protein COB66_07615 [Coxiella sp. (in: g-proteobacteria)]